MFERFTAQARAAVVEAQVVARAAASRSIDSRHLLIALLETGEGAQAVLRAVGVEPARLAASLREELNSGGLDADALASVGIDLDAIRRRADAVFGEGALDRGHRPPPRGHLPFAPEAKKALELALREAVRLRTNRIDDEMLLLGLLRATGSPASRALDLALTDAGSSTAALRATVERRAA